MDEAVTGIRKRVSIRRRFLTTVLLTTIISILAVSITGYLCIRWNRDATEETLLEQLEINLKGVVLEKVNSIDAKLDHYEKYVQLITDNIGSMYEREGEAISQGRMFYPPTNTHEYELARVFASAKLTEADLNDEILFFSNLESLWEPIAKENEDLITTLYVGTEKGLLASYDKFSYLSKVPEGRDAVYNFHTSEWYKKGSKEDGIFYTGVYMDYRGRGLTVAVGKSFNDAKGELAGVACVDFDLAALYDDLFTDGVENGMFVFALDQKDAVIAPNSDTLDLLEYTGLTLDELDFLKADEDGVMEKNDLVYVSIPLERVGWTLCASIPKETIQKSIHDADAATQNAILVFAIAVALILVAAVIAVNRSIASITRPLEQLERDIKVISEGNLDYRATVYRNDEIGDITSGMNAMVDRLNFTLKELMSSQQEADAMSRLATLDSLTGVRNKTAFDGHARILAEELSAGRKEFGFALADLNNLKLINDNFGHEKGDIAIQRVCHIVCEIFAHSPVYRVGGDEFVVVLEGEDYRNVDALMERFKDEVRKVSNDRSLDPWERVSAAIGYAMYDERVDSGTDSVLDRADQEMYACKKEMKGL